MPATTMVGMINMAIAYKNAKTFWFVVARTQTPWANEGSPPAESTTVTSLSEIAGLQRAQTVSLCYPDPNGSIRFRGQNYTLVSDANAYSYDSRFLYLSTLLLFDTFPVVTFRQTGIHVDVVPVAGKENATILLPADVSSYGTLLAYVNHPPIYRTVGSKNLLEVVIELVPQVV